MSNFRGGGSCDIVAIPACGLCGKPAAFNIKLGRAGASLCVDCVPPDPVLLSCNVCQDDHGCSTCRKFRRKAGGSVTGMPNRESARRTPQNRAEAA